MFNETAIAELSTIDQFSSADGHSVRRQVGNLYSVENISDFDDWYVHGSLQ
jgi:hypothetical protein